MGENHFTTLPVAAYGLVLLMSGVAYAILARSLVAHHSDNAELAEAIGKDAKGKLSVLLYALGIGLSFVSAWLGFGVYCAVAIMWLVPDRRIERKLSQS
jgi:uncharacterized membrane protein